MSYPESHSPYADQFPITIANHDQTTSLTLSGRVADGMLALDAEMLRLVLNGYRAEHPNDPLELRIPLLGGAAVSNTTVIEEPTMFFDKRITIDHKEVQAYFDGSPIRLTHKEYELFSVLGRNKGRAMRRQDLLNLVWGEPFYGTARTLDTHVKRLRDKTEPEAIDTLRNFGFRAAA